MMMTVYSETEQDTVQIKNVVLQDTVEIKSDSTSFNVILQDSSGFEFDSTSFIETGQGKDSIVVKPAPVHKKAELKIVDTTSVCTRNKVADIIFNNSQNPENKVNEKYSNKFPYIFIEKTKQKQVDTRSSLIKHLNPGQDLPAQPIHEDWIIAIILIPAFLYSLIRATSKNMLPAITRFFLFRGINDPSSRDTGSLFQWQSTIQNLISFIIIGLYIYCASTYYDFMPFGIKGITVWLISLGISIFSITIRHIVCIIIGNASKEIEVFKEYLVIVYQSYRFSSLLLYFLIIMLLYTTLLPAKFYFVSGFCVLSIMYLIRIIRLMIIFISRNLSILYMILYLCALEIMPVMIFVKYFTGLK